MIDRLAVRGPAAADRDVAGAVSTPFAPPSPPRARLPFRSRAAIYLGLGTLQRAIGLLLAPLYAHSLTPADYGLLTFLLSTEALFGVVMDLGLSSGAVRACFDLDRDRRDRFLAYAQFASLTASGAVFLLLALASGAYLLASGQPSRTGLLVGLILLSAFGQRVNALAASFYRAQEDAHAFAVLALIRVLAIPLLSLAVALALGLGLAAILAIRVAVFGATALWELAEAYRRRGTREEEHDLGRILRDALRTYGLPLLPHNLMKWGRVQGLRVLLGAAMSLSLLALYSIASLPLQLLSLTGTASDQLFEPLYYRERAEGRSGAAERLRGAASVILAGQATLAIAAMMVVPDAFRLLFPPVYQPAALYAPMLLAGQYLTMIQAVWFKPLVYDRRASRLPLVTGISTLVGAVATVAAASAWGLAGATLGYVATTALGAWLAVRFVDRAGGDATMPRGTALALCVVVLVAGALPIAADLAGHTALWLAPNRLWLRLPVYVALAGMAALPLLSTHRPMVTALLRGRPTA